MNKVQILNLVDSILLILFLLVGFVPYFDAMDKVAPQYVYLSLLCAISSIHNFFFTEKESFKNANYVIFSFTLFSIWSLLSITHALNKSEVLIESSRVLVFLIVFINMFLILDRNQRMLRYIPYLITAILFIELISVYERFFERYTGGSYSRDMGLRAFSGNINITAFSILMKLPFLLFSLYKIKWASFIKVLLLSSFSFCIFLLGSRGANITLIIIFCVIVILYYKLNQVSFINKKTILLLLISLVLGGILNYNIFQKDSSINLVSRTVNLNTSSTQQRLRFYNAALESIIINPVFGVGIGNWKLYSIEKEKPYMKDYTVPYHAHNDFLEVTAELGIVGFILYFGIFIWIFFLIFNSIKSKEYEKNENIYLVILASISLLIYLSDSFLNFPFTRPLMQIQNLFFWSLILVTLKYSYKIHLFDFILRINTIKIVGVILIFLASIFTIYISIRVYSSFVDQQFLTAAGTGNLKQYKKEQVFSIKSDIPSITASTVPIETLKANLLYNIDYIDDTLHYMVEKGKTQNPFMPYNELTRSVLYIKERKPDSAYIFAKKAYYDVPNHDIHFNLLMDIIEAYKDSIELEKAINFYKGELRDQFYEKYLQVSLNIKNKIGLTEAKFLDKYNSKNPDSEVGKIMNVINKVGKKNVEEAYYESLEANDFFENKKFIEAGESFLKASSLNPFEISYFENAANSFIQAGEDDKAVNILKNLINKLDPKTGKAEYLLGITLIGKKTILRDVNI